MGERRAFERFMIEFPLRFLDVNAGKEGRGKVINISASGSGMLIIQTVLEPGASLEIWLHLPNKQDPFHIRGEVVWCKEVEPGIYRVGVKFDNVDFMGVSSVLRAHNEKNKDLSFFLKKRERGIEPPYIAWKAIVLPLSYSRKKSPSIQTRGL